MLVRKGLGIVLLFAVVLLAGCMQKHRIVVNTNAILDTLEVSIDIYPSTGGTARFEGEPSFEKVGPIKVSASGNAKVSVPIGAVPMGKHTITVLFEGDGRGIGKRAPEKTTFVYERKPLAATLKVKPVARAGSIDVSCKGDLCDSSTRLPLGPDAKLSVDFTSCDGCTVEVSGQKIAVKGEHTPALVDLTSAIAAAPASQVASISEMKIPVKITTREGGSSDGSLDMLGTVLTATLLRRVAQGPVPLPGDAAGGAPKNAIVVRKEAEYGVVTTAGSPSHVRDFDLVGVAASSERSLGTCGVYESSTTKNKVTVDHRGVTYDVTMYDRRTGRSLGKRSFPPNNTGCSDTLTGGTKAVVNLPSDEAVAAWAKTFLR